MDIAKGPEHGDITIEQAGINVFLDKKADTLLANVTMDYSALHGFIVTGATQGSCCS